MARTLINVVLDKSGSMSPLRGDTIRGFNAWLATQQKESVDEAYLTLTLFDTSYKILYQMVPLAKVEPLTTAQYDPDGSTALWDAIGKTVVAVEKEQQPGDRMLTIIMTDGQENASQEYKSLDQIKAFITNREKRGNQTFVFIGANLDAYGGAEMYGGAMGTLLSNSLNYRANAQGMSAAWQATASSTYAYRGSNMAQSNNFYSQEQKDDVDHADDPYSTFTARREQPSST